MPAPFTVGLAALFGSELPNPGGMKAEVGGREAVRRMPHGWQGRLDQDLQTFSVKGQIVNILDFMVHMASAANCSTLPSEHDSRQTVSQ